LIELTLKFENYSDFQNFAYRQIFTPSQRYPFQTISTSAALLQNDDASWKR